MIAEGIFRMSMTEWAENEVKIASEKDKDGAELYENALEAYKVLCSFGHSGGSMSIAKAILCRLIDGGALTAIEDTDDVWSECSWTDDKGRKVYQCKRMASLFKHVGDDTVYYDINRTVLVSQNGNAYHSGLADEIVDEISPIQMPYFPSGQYTVYGNDFLYKKDGGDYDTLGILRVEYKGKKLSFRPRYYAEKDGKMQRISFLEYKWRWIRRVCS